MSGSINQGPTIAAAPAPVPFVTSDVPAEVGYGQSVVIGTISAATAFSPLSVVFVGDAPQGSLSINAQDEVVYTGPGKFLPGEVDSFTYEIEDSIGGVSAPVSVSLAIDPGPSATDPSLSVGHAGTLDLSDLLGTLAVPGLSGDTLTLVAASAANGEIVQNSAGDFIYEPISPANGQPITVGYNLMGNDATNSNGSATTSGYDLTDNGTGAGKSPFSSDTITYTVTDQLGDTVVGTATIDIDPGPTAIDPTLIVGHGQTLDLSGIVGQLAIPGQKGDTLTLTAASAANGEIVQTKAGDLVYEAFSVSGGSPTTVGYNLGSNDPNDDSAAPGYDLAGNGTGAGTTAFSSDVVTYTVTDQFGDTVTGAATIDIDPGPSATDPSFVIGHGGTIDFSTMASKLATPGLAGDTLTVTAASAYFGTVVQNAAGDLVYEPPATGGANNVFNIKAGDTDTVSYTVSDQYGDTVTGTATVTVDPGPTVAPGQLTVGHGQTVNLVSTIESLITPGLSGDKETITGVTAQQSKISAVDGQLDYTAPAGGSDTVTFNVKDSYGDTAMGSIAITVDPGPTATDPDLVVGHGVTLDLSTMASQLATAGLAGDTLTVTAASAANGTIVQTKGGDFVYEPIANGGSGPTTVGYDLNGQGAGKTTTSTGSMFGSDTITYTVTDQVGDTTIGTASVLVDPGPTATDPDLIVGHAGTIDLSAIVGQLAAPGLTGDTLTVTAASAQAGTIFENKAGEFIYEPIAAANGSPTTIGYDLSSSTTGESAKGEQSSVLDDVVTYTVQDEAGDTVTGAANISVDPGPTVIAGQTIVAPGHTVDLTGYLESLIVPGFKGDTETITSVSAQTGEASIENSANGALTVDYTAPASGNDTLTFDVQDQYGDTATGTVAITVDAGPILAPGTYTIGHGQSANLFSYVESLITPGAPGLTDTITSVRAEYGQAELASYSDSGIGAASDEINAIDYAAPASGNDLLTYTVADQDGLTSTGTVAISVDPGPTAGNVSANIAVGQTIDLTQQILGADKPGLSGDTLTLASDNIQGTLGTVSLVNGDLVYTASSSAFASLGAGASVTDSFGYTVSDQYGDQASGTVTLDVSNPVTTVNGNPNGGATIEGPAGNAVINAYGWNNQIYANGGNDTINAGQGNATVYDGSGNVTVSLNGYNNVVSGGNGTDTVTGGLGDTTVTLGNGNDTVTVGGYNNSITVGNGNDTIVTDEGNTTLVGGSGNDVVTLAGYQDSVSFTGGSDTITGGAGSDTYNLTGGNASVVLNGYSDMVFLHSTNATIMDAGQGAVIEIAGGGTDVIQGAGSDSSLLVDLTGGLGGYTSAASVIAALTPDGNGGALLSFGASHGSLDFAGVAPSMLHASNFQVG